MGKLSALEPKRVFEYFEEISAIPRGSGNMEQISSYCMEFAKKHGLRAQRDAANNVIIYKDGAAGYETAEAVILQGHLDMVCQKADDCDIDFEKDGISLVTEGDTLRADGTTLGADNGIAVAMMLAILASDDIAHPPLEALFTTDEEVGMLGAMALCTDGLRGKKLINLDAEDPNTITVSCAGGSDFCMTMRPARKTAHGTRVILNLKGLAGGHSGIEIDSGRVNADILMGRVLNEAKAIGDFELLSVNGGNKGNAIPLCCSAEMVVANEEVFLRQLNDRLAVIKREIADREPDFAPTLCVMETGEFEALAPEARDRLIATLLCVPNGVVERSISIEDLVETSLNLGILKTETDKLTLHFTLRSNKQTALEFLEKRLLCFANAYAYESEVFVH
ncbi:MAG: beta-Ala-His dipeptidase, partial [Clostridia bacterium]|nr:beta-Ala-His dipeptidase [Clostridia bacterium]